MRQGFKEDTGGDEKILTRIKKKELFQSSVVKLKDTAYVYLKYMVIWGMFWFCQ